MSFKPGETVKQSGRYKEIATGDVRLMGKLPKRARLQAGKVFPPTSKKGMVWEKI